MKKIVKKMSLLLIILYVVATFFMPLFVLDGNNIFAYKIIFDLSKCNVFPLIAFLLALIGSLLLLFKNIFKNIEGISMCLFILAGVLIIMSPSFCTDENMSLSWVAYFNSILYFCISFILMYILNIQNKLSVYEIVEMAMLIALAVGLDLPGFKIPLGANGGSISLSMIPLFILCFRQGVIKGFLGCGVIYGIITCLIDGWGLQAYPFDYLLAYGSICVSGYFTSLIFSQTQVKFNIKGASFLALAVLVGCILRLSFATLSGMIFYETPFVASLSYNAAYIMPSCLVAIIVLVALYKPLININKVISNHVQVKK